MTKYDVLLDVQDKKCYTCAKYRKCKVLEGDVPCEYKISTEAKAEIKGVKPFWSK